MKGSDPGLRRTSAPTPAIDTAPLRTPGCHGGSLRGCLALHADPRDRCRRDGGPQFAEVVAHLPGQARIRALLDFRHWTEAAALRRRTVAGRDA